MIEVDNGMPKYAEICAFKGIAVELNVRRYQPLSSI